MWKSHLERINLSRLTKIIYKFKSIGNENLELGRPKKGGQRFCKQRNKLFSSW